MKELPDIPKSAETTIADYCVRICDVIFPQGNYWWYLVYVIMLIGLSLFGIYTATIISYLDTGQIIHTDTFTAAMPFATSHLQTPLSTAVISFLLDMYGYLMAAFFYYIGLAFAFDVSREVQSRIYKEKSEDEL